MKCLVWLGCCLLSSFSSALSASLTKEDFAYGLPIELRDTAAIYQLELPEIVYQHLTSIDYRDLRIFNGAGEVVPHSLRHADKPLLHEQDAVMVPFYPYKMRKPGADHATNVQVIINDQGAVVLSNATADETHQARVSAYLLDMRTFEEPPTKLVLDWESPQDQFETKVRLDGSNDLNHWQPVVTQASLVRLHFAGRDLGQEEIELPHNDYQYLQLSWPSDVDGVMLTQVQAYLAPKQQLAKPNWLTLTGVVDVLQKNIFYYENKARLPISWVEVLLPQNNSLVDVKLSSRQSDAHRWHDYYQGSFYRLQVADARLVTHPVQISVTNTRFWRMTATSDLAGMGESIPELSLGYVPHQLFFLARGEPPFVLAFGAQQLPANQGQVNTILQRIDNNDKDLMISTAHTGELITLGGAQVLLQPPAPFPWQQIILWSVLILGVAMLGMMVWRLSKQM